MTTDLQLRDPDTVVAPNSDDARSALEHYLTTGDLSRLDGRQRIALYFEICRSIHLNPRYRPLEFLEFWDAATKAKRLVLYPTHEASDQLAYLHKIRVRTVEEKMTGTLFKVVMEGTMPDGRTETNVAYLDLTDSQGQPLKGQKYGDALMKTHTKCKRRLVLGMVGFNVPIAGEALERGRRVLLDAEGNVLDHPTREQRELAEHPTVARAIGAATWEDLEVPETGLEDEPDLPVRPDPGPPPRTGPRPSFRTDPETVKRLLGAWFAAVKGSSLDDDDARARYITQWTATIDWPEKKQTDSLRTFFARATEAEAADLLAHTRAIVEGERHAQAAGPELAKPFDEDAEEPV